MRRSIPLAYVTASYSNCTSGAQIAKAAQKYCTRIKEAGYIPVCPGMYLSMFLKRNNAKDKVLYKEMSEELLRRCRVLVIYFHKMNAVMEEADRREFLTHLIEMVEIYEEEQPNGQWLKSITFKLPIIPHDMEICLDNGSHVENCVRQIIEMEKQEKQKTLTYDRGTSVW